MKSWRNAANQLPMVVLEDDVILAHNLKDETEFSTYKSQDPSLILLGWNMDSMLRAEFLLVLAS